MGRLLSDRRARYLALALILLLGAALRITGLAWGLQDANVERRPHPDEWAIFWLFHWFDVSHSPNPCPSAGSGHCFFDWGSGYIYASYLVRLLLAPLSALLDRFFGSSADPSFVLAILSGRLVSVLASILTVAVVYSLASEGYGKPTGLLAALLVAVSALLIQLAHFATPDATAILLSTLSLLLMWRAIESPSRRAFLAASLTVGVSIGVEANMAMLLLPLAAAWLLASGSPRHWLPAAYAAAAVGFVITNPFVVIDLPAFVAQTHHGILMRTLQSGLQYQGRFGNYGSSWLYVLRYPLGFGLGFALAAWAVAGLLWACVRRSKFDLLLLSWLVPYLLLVSLTPVRFMRYGAPLLPGLAILAAALFVELQSRRSRWIRSAASTALCITLAYSIAYDTAYVGLFAKPEPRYVATNWLLQHAARGSNIQFETLPNGLASMPYFTAPANYRPCFSEFDTKNLESPAQYVVLDSYSLESHPGISQETVDRFRVALLTSRHYSLAFRVRYVPTLLGASFPIDSSPHDWRYPEHEISIYRHISGPRTARSGCYRSVGAAVSALYYSVSHKNSREPAG